MMIIREIKDDDLEALCLFSKHTLGGFTSLPSQKDFLKKKIDRSVSSFEKKVTEPGDELYFFVLEDTQTKQAVGCCAIEAMVGINNPFYSYKILHETAIYQPEKIRANHDVLILVNDFQNCSELCSLFLESAYRNKYHGKLLSFSRLMYISMARYRFSDTLFAEIRGVSANDYCPFWEGLGKKFFKMDFPKADFLNGTGEPIIEALMPRFPIYCCLLSPETQEVIGKTHAHSVSAFDMLKSQGLEYTGYVDMFDGGPTLSAKMDNVHAIAHSCPVQIAATQKNLSGGHLCLIGTLSPKISFLVDHVKIRDDGRAIISESVARALEKAPDDEIQIYPLGS